MHAFAAIADAFVIILLSKINRESEWKAHKKGNGEFGWNDQQLHSEFFTT